MIEMPMPLGGHQVFSLTAHPVRTLAGIQQDMHRQSPRRDRPRPKDDME